MTVGFHARRNAAPVQRAVDGKHYLMQADTVSVTDASFVRAMTSL
jgi:hypothetical protein